MASQVQEKIDDALNLNYGDDIWLKRSQTLRRLIGLLGISLPLILLLCSFWWFHLDHPLPSISHYYFTRAGTIFTVILSLIAIFLIVYSGYEPIDFYISSLAGIFALCVVFFPTGNLSEVCCNNEMEYVVTYFEGTHFREIFHLISAAIFLLLLAAMSIFLFTLSKDPPGFRPKNKQIRNRIYRTCGILIIISLLVILAGMNNFIPPTFYEDNQLTFWMETLAVESFGISWLIKGETLFSDESK